MIFVGLARSISDVRNSTWETLIELSCNHQVLVHITLGTSETNPHFSRFCAKVWIDSQDDILSRSSLDGLDRVERLAVIRDAQRNRVRQVLFSFTKFSGDGHFRESVVINADLDLRGVPSAPEIMKRVELIVSRNLVRPHVICASGKALRRHDIPPYKSKLYYDTFATVALPDLFFYAPGHRRYPVEDPMIKGMSLQQITEFFVNIAKQHPNSLAPVRSCFSGLALYRASAWLTPHCQYSLHHHNNTQFLLNQPRDSKGNLTIHRYSSIFFKVPCEHVVFHDCLHRQVFPNMTRASVNESSSSEKIDVVVDPAFETFRLW